jgi:hypothetical protein
MGWYMVCVLAVVGLITQYLTWTWKPSPREVYILDPQGNVYYGASYEPSHQPLFHLLATDAAMVFFQRSVAGGGTLDQEDFATRIYHKGALELLKQDVQRQREDLVSRNIHQKVEVGHIRQMEEKSGRVYVLVEGQLIRAGRVGNLPLTEAVPFSLVLCFERNPSPAPGRSPWVVTEWARKQPDDY